MKRMTAGVPAITAVKAIITTITAAFSAAFRSARAALESTATRAIPVAAPPGIRRHATRYSGISRPIGLVRPEYLPALERSLILRLRIARQVHQWNPSLSGGCTDGGVTRADR